ncbi:hypothetical protein Btru_010288 [Bulinus truncatus]|nr:hypothetical protein Btru_010288 [Bulinus truncatus]
MKLAAIFLLVIISQCTLARNLYPSACNQYCTGNIEPVCGSDGHTYPSLCKLNAANCYKPTKVYVAYRGECRQNPQYY